MCTDSMVMPYVISPDVCTNARIAMPVSQETVLPTGQWMPRRRRRYSPPAYNSTAATQPSAKTASG